MRSRPSMNMEHMRHSRRHRKGTAPARDDPAGPARASEKVPISAHPTELISWLLCMSHLVYSYNITSRFSPEKR